MDEAEHIAQLTRNTAWEWMLHYEITGNRELFDRDTVIYKFHQDEWFEHFTTFQNSEDARLGYHKVMALGARFRQLRRRMVAWSDWDQIHPEELNP